MPLVHHAYGAATGIDFVSKSVPVDNGTVRLQL